MSYVLVEDVAASWERYEAIARSVERAPTGLVLHVAGPTDEGFRIVEIWESEAAWRRFEPDLRAALGSTGAAMSPRTAVRDLRAVHEVVGNGWSGLLDPRAGEER
jgi:hypothetical protein